MDAPKAKEISQENFTIKSDKNKSFSLCIQNVFSSIFIYASYQGESKKMNMKNLFLWMI